MSQKSNERGQWLTESAECRPLNKKYVTSASSAPTAKWNIQPARFGGCCYSQSWFSHDFGMFIVLSCHININKTVYLNILGDEMVFFSKYHLDDHTTDAPIFQDSCFFRGDAYVTGLTKMFGTLSHLKWKTNLPHLNPIKIWVQFGRASKTPTSASQLYRSFTSTTNKWVASTEMLYACRTVYTSFQKECRWLTRSGAVLNSIRLKSSGVANVFSGSFIYICFQYFSLKMLSMYECFVNRVVSLSIIFCNKCYDDHIFINNVKSIFCQSFVISFV